MVMVKTKQLTSSISPGQLLTSLPPELCGNILREVLKKTTLSLETVSNSLKKAGRVLNVGGNHKSTEIECLQCDLLIGRYSETLNSNWLQLTAVTITFNWECSSEQQHIVASLCTMSNLRYLALFRVGAADSFYSELARRNGFTLDQFGCDSPITESLVRFLIGQPQISECSILAGSRTAYRLPSRYHTVKLLSNVTLLRTTAPLLTDALFDLSSVRRLEYVGDSNKLIDQITAIDRICQLGPQLEALRFEWDTGTVGTFLDVTKFVQIAECTSALRYLQMINVNKNVFEEFVAAGLESKTWLNLGTLVWVSDTPWTVENTVDTLGSDGKSIITLHRHHKISTISNTINCPHIYIDRDFRIQCIARELMKAFPSLHKFAIWNWKRNGYDVMSRKCGFDGGLLWNYRVHLDEDEWMNV